jgi:hypothetical protein
LSWQRLENALDTIAHEATVGKFIAAGSILADFLRHRHLYDDTILVCFSLIFSFDIFLLLLRQN